MTWANATSTYSSDYNGFRPNRGVDAQYNWMAPTQPGQTLYYNKPEDWKSFPTLAALRAATGQEAHGVELDFDIFEKMTPPDPAPQKRQRRLPQHGPQLPPPPRLEGHRRRTTPAHDQRQLHGHTQPGALELGQPAPHYGPRWLTWQPFYR